MNKFFGILLFLIAYCHSFAQKSPIKFGEIPLEDLRMTSYPLDSSAAAVILSNYGEAYLKVIGDEVVLTFERHVRIKILKKDGLDWANVSIPLYHSGGSEEKMMNLKASTYNLDKGKIIESKMSKEGIFKEKFSRYTNYQKFTLPNVKEGSVIEYSYNLQSDYYTQFPNWEFQKSIPVRWSEFWAIIPEDFIYEKYMQGYLPVTSYETKQIGMTDYTAKAQHWICKDVPAFKEEPYMTNEEDYRSKVNFALSHINTRTGTKEIMGSWEKLKEDLLKNESFWGVISGSGFLKEKAAEITAGITDPDQKVEKIYTYVKQNLEWDGQKDYLADNLKKIFEARKGTSGDINLALASLLDKAGVSVNMILLSTRDHGVIRQSYPMSRQFNYVVCAVRMKDKTVLLDATEKFLPMGILPERCLNGEGMIVSKLDFGWMKLETKTKEKTTTTTELKLDETGELTGNVNLAMDGYAANSMRKEYNKKGEEKFIKDFIGTKPWDVRKTTFENVSDIGLTAKQNHDVSITDNVSAAGDVMYINPFLINDHEENPFKQETRQYPVDFGRNIERLYMFKMTIPDSYIVDELPKSKVINLAGNAARYTLNASQTGNIINIVSMFQINKGLFLQEEYPNLKEFYNQIIAKQSEQIVIKKK
jgi:hypothetical protein